MSASNMARRTSWLPLHDFQFWVVQVLIALVFVLHEIDDGDLGIRASSVIPHLAVEALFLFPLLYAALNFGLRGSLITAGWVTLLMSVDISLNLSSLSHLNLWAHYVELATLDIMAVVVGRGVEIQRLARQRAEAAETRYRQLYESAGVPILVLDDQGVVSDANPSALAAFGGNVIGRTSQNLLPGGSLSREYAGQALRLPNGRDYRASLVSLPSDTGATSTQVIFEDITEEHRESRRATLYASLVVGADEDRRRLMAREQLEEPIQMLLQLARRLESLGDSDSAPAPRSLGNDRRGALESATRLRTLARELRPPTLDDLGLVAALSSLLADVDEETDLTTEFQVVGDAVRLTPEVELGAFRIIEEAVRNTVRHARARQLRLFIALGTHELELTMVDDGCGFTPESLDSRTTKHLGLLSISERSRLLGGHLQLRSEPGGGTSITVRIPLDPPRANRETTIPDLGSTTLLS
jgi:PAS domain S-box-containing protein